MLTASALNSSEYRRRVFLVMNTSNASSMRLTGVSAPIRPVQPDTQEMLESLRECVSRELERKRRLGHYAVIWQDASEVPRRLPNLKSCWQLCWQPCDYFRESESVSQQCPRRTGPLHL